MVRYDVIVHERGNRDLEDIFKYIACEKLSPENALGQIKRIKDAVIGLQVFPESHQERLSGRYAGMGYRQVLIDNYIVVFRIDDGEKTVHVITIQYKGRNI